MSAGYAYVVESFKGKQDGGEYAVLYYYTGYMYNLRILALDIHPKENMIYTYSTESML